MGIASRIAQPLVEERAFMPFTMDEYVKVLTEWGGLTVTQTLNNQVEEIDDTFPSLLASAYKGNPILSAALLARQMLFSEARFQFRQLRGGTPGDLFGTEALSVLERPWPGATTGDLLSRMILSADIAGNAFVHRRFDRLKVLRPDWVTIMVGGDGVGSLDSEVIGYIYHPGGRYSGRPPEILAVESVAHFAPPPKDPAAEFRGMSWIGPLIPDIRADSAATQHKLNFFLNGATANMVVSIPETARLTPQTFREWVEAFDQDHKGVANAYKTIYLAGGADAKVVGADLKQIDFKATQGAGETRIALLSGIHPVILAISEGMEGSTLNAGNFNAAKRMTAEKTLRPLWRDVCGSLQTIVPAPPGSQLWYDDQDIPFLQEDVKDAAEVQSQQATSIRTLTDGGYTPESVIDAITSGDYKRLKHAGYLPVQVQSIKPEDINAANTNGKAASSKEASDALVSQEG